MDDTTRQRLTHFARLAAAHSIGDQEALARALAAAHADGLAWDVCYEALLQLVAYTGYPRTINALTIYRVVSGLPAAERPSEEWASHAATIWPERGAAIFRQLWPGHEPGDNVRPVSAELAEWVVCDDFGRIFGRPGLTLLEREAVVIGSLIAQRAAPQMRSHRLAFLAVGGDEPALDALVAALADLLPAVALDDAHATLARLRAGPSSANP
jgi:4-carboxymuconolactone decarboxylase